MYICYVHLTRYWVLSRQVTLYTLFISSPLRCSLVYPLKAGLAQSVYGSVMGWTTGVWFTSWVRDFPILHSTQTDSGTHPASYPICTGEYFLGGKAVGVWICIWWRDREWCSTSTPKYIFMLWTLINYQLWKLYFYPYTPLFFQMVPSLSFSPKPCMHYSFVYSFFYDLFITAVSISVCRASYNRMPPNRLAQRWECRLVSWRFLVRMSTSTAATLTEGFQSFSRSSNHISSWFISHFTIRHWTWREVIVTEGN
jgi:hypothetical protein